MRKIIALLVVAFALSCGVCTSSGQRAEIISQSYNGRYQVRPSYYVDPNDVPLKLFHLEIFDTKKKKTIFVSRSNYGRLGTENLTLWHHSRPLLAIHVQDSRRYGHTELYSINKDGVTELELPDYQRSALAKAGATDAFNEMSAFADAWHGNDLWLDLEFDACEKNTRNYAGIYTGEAVLRVENPGRSPVVKLRRVSIKPQ